MARKQQLIAFRRAASQGEPYSAVILTPYQDAAELDASCQKLARHVEAWLNEEWTPLEVHRDLAKEAAQQYKELRLRGEDELGSILLGLGTSLLQFDFNDTFVNSFEVSNKVAELLMLEEGREVCCRSDSDKEVYERIEQEN